MTDPLIIAENQVSLGTEFSPVDPGTNFGDPNSPGKFLFLLSILSLFFSNHKKQHIFVFPVTLDAGTTTVNVDLTNDKYPDEPQVGSVSFPVATNVDTVTVQFREGPEEPFQTIWEEVK